MSKRAVKGSRIEKKGQRFQDGKNDRVVVMDNMRSHHVEPVEELWRKNGMIPLYLPPYSPVLNPIEMMWSQKLFSIYQTVPKRAIIVAEEGVEKDEKKLSE